MALLGPRKRALGLAALALGGCAFVQSLLPGGDQPMAFSHRLHVVEQGLDCESCHENAWYEDAAGWPWQDTCLVCHDELDTDKAQERHIELAFPATEEGPLSLVSQSALSDELVFSHLTHVQADVACAECHRGIEQSDRVGADLAVDMAACVRCHQEREQPAECATCHREVDQQWKPPGHLIGWERAHGRASRTCADNMATECSLCHDERTCADCHLVTEPRDHGQAFRTRTHGFHAAMDRTRCATCHEPDSCDLCHQETEPRSHFSLTWGGTRSRHCLGCHLPIKANGCQVCHPSAPSHLLAAPKPDWHTPAMNCRQCHGVTAPLPHVEKGDDCNACHH